MALIVFTQGLKISPRQAMIYFKERPWLMLRSLLAVLVLVPAAALAIILLLKPSPGVAIGLAILACPPAPLMIKATPKVGQGSAAYMASLHLSLAALAFFTVPMGLSLLSMPWFSRRSRPARDGDDSREDDSHSDHPRYGGPILLPAFAGTIGPKLEKAGTAGLRVVVLFALAALYPTLLKMDPWSYLVIVVVSAAALAIGHWLGPRDPHERITLAVESGVRHPVLAIAIASANFTPEKALPVLVPCVLMFIICAMVYMLWQRRSLADQDDR